MITLSFHADQGIAILDTAVLLVEDNSFQREMVRQYLASRGAPVTAVATPAAFREAVELAMPDVALLDVGLPGEDGFSLARWLRARSSDVGIIMLTAAGELVDRVLGLESGADDYLTKPFAPRELLARISAVARRAQPAKARASPSHGDSSHRVPVGVVILDVERRLLIRQDGLEEKLTKGEFELLHLLLRHPDRPLYRDWLLEATTPDGATDTHERAINLRIMRLRRKVEADPDNPQVIRTVRGVGYIYLPRGMPVG